MNLTIIVSKSQEHRCVWHVLGEQLLHKDVSLFKLFKLGSFKNSARWVLSQSMLCKISI